MRFTILGGLEELEVPLVHYDAGIFPGTSDWYSIFEQFVAFDSRFSHLVYGCLTGRHGDVAEVDENTNREFYGTAEGEGDGPFHDIAEAQFTADAQQSVHVLFPLYLEKTSVGITRLSSLDNYYSVDYRPLCSCVSVHQYVGSLLMHILRSESPHSLALRGVDLDAPEIGIIIHMLKEAGWKPYLKVHQLNWVHDVEGSYENYIAGRPGRLRSTLRRKTAKLMKLPDVQFSVHDDRKDLDHLLQIYQQVYDLSWKVPEPHPHFIPQLISACAKSGQLRLGLLRIGDAPVAIHFWVVKGGTAFIYKLAHDSSYDSYSPGTLLMAHMVRHVIENDGVKRLDFLSGDDAYKRDWMSVRRKKYVVTAYRPYSLLAQSDRFFEQHLRPFVKQLALGVAKMAKWN